MNIGGTTGATPQGKLLSPIESQNLKVLGEQITRELLQKYDELMEKSGDNTQPTKKIQDTIIKLIEKKMGEGSFRKAIRIINGKENQAVPKDELDRAYQIDRILKFAKTQFTWHKRRKQLRQSAEPIINAHAKKLARATEENLPKLLSNLETLTYNLIVRIEEDQQNTNRQPPTDEVEHFVIETLRSQLETILEKLFQQLAELRKVTTPIIEEYVNFRKGFVIKEDVEKLLSHLKSLSNDLILRIEMHYLIKTKFIPQSEESENDVKRKVIFDLNNILEGLKPANSPPSSQQEMVEILNNAKEEELQEIDLVTEFDLMELVTPTTLLLFR